MERTFPKRCIAIGEGTEANFDDSIALGYHVKTTREKQVVIGNETSSVVITSECEGEGSILIAGVDIVKELNDLKRLVHILSSQNQKI